MDTPTPTLPGRALAPDGPVVRGLYLSLVALMAAIVLLGFRPFYAALLTGDLQTHWVIGLHAAVFSGWMGLLAVQVALAYRRRADLHRRLGQAGVVLGLLVLASGLLTTFVATALQVEAGRSTLDEAAGFLVLPLGDMLLFGGFFAAAIAWRRQRELHKRLMVLATVALLFAPAARLAGDAGWLAVLPVWLSPLALALAHDAVVRRRVEPVYLLGTAVLLMAFARVRLLDAEGWLVIGRALLAPWLAPS